MDTKFEYRTYRGYTLKVVFVPRARLYPFFGQAVGGIGQRVCYAEVRDDLPPLVKEFVITHELYHLVDLAKWWGARGRETRANFIPALDNPLGFVMCILATIFMPGRLRLYAHRFLVGR